MNGEEGEPQRGVSSVPVSDRGAQSPPPEPLHPCIEAGVGVGVCTGQGGPVEAAGGG